MEKTAVAPVQLIDNGQTTTAMEVVEVIRRSFVSSHQVQSLELVQGSRKVIVRRIDDKIQVETIRGINSSDPRPDLKYTIPQYQLEASLPNILSELIKFGWMNPDTDVLPVSSPPQSLYYKGASRGRRRQWHGGRHVR